MGQPRQAGEAAGPPGYPPPEQLQGGWAGAAPAPQAYAPPYQAQYPPPPVSYPGPSYASPAPAPPAGYPQPAAGYYPPPQHLPQRPPHQQAYKPPQPPPQGFDSYDVEAQQAANYAAAFAEDRVRKQFVRRVFSLVFIQLCITVGVACVFLFVQPVRDYVRPGGPGQWVFIVTWIVSLVVLISLMCSNTLRRKHPWNLLALLAFTLVESVLVGVICSYWDVGVVLEAFGATAAAVGGLTLVAVFGKFDMTKRGHLLSMASGVLFMLLLVTMLFGFFFLSKWWYLAISVIVAILFSCYLVYHIQLVMGGKKVAISPDEYVFASVQIYLDVVTLFLALLSIMGIARS